MNTPFRTKGQEVLTVGCLACFEHLNSRLSAPNPCQLSRRGAGSADHEKEHLCSTAADSPRLSWEPTSVSLRPCSAGVAAASLQFSGCYSPWNLLLLLSVFQDQELKVKRLVRAGSIGGVSLSGRDLWFASTCVLPLLDWFQWAETSARVAWDTRQRGSVCLSEGRSQPGASQPHMGC